MSSIKKKNTRYKCRSRVCINEEDKRHIEMSLLPIVHQEAAFIPVMMAVPSVAVTLYSTYKSTMAVYNAGITLSSWSVSFMSAYAMFKLGSKAFTKFYGTQLVSDLSTTMNKVWNASDRQALSKQDTFSHISRLAALGKGTSPADISKIRSTKGMSFSILILGFILLYLHNMGALKMRDKIRLHAATHHRKGVHVADPQADETADKTQDKGLFSRITGLFYAQKNTADADVAAEKGEQEGDEDDFFEYHLRNLYESHPFYSTPLNDIQQNEKNESPGLFSPKDAHVARIIFNIILGIIMQLNGLWLDRSSAIIDDPVKTLTRATSFLVYWEVLARVLRLYGWAPLYIATRQVMLLVASPPP